MNLRRIKEIIYGVEPEFDLKQIVFHKICFIATLGLTIGLALSIYIRQWDVAVMVVLAQLVLTLCYWFSRIMRLFKVAWVLFVITSYVLFILNYFLNSGLDGTTLVMSFMTLSILFAGTESKYHWRWTLVHGIVFGGLVLMELFYGKDFLSLYKSEELRYTDHLAVYLLSISFFYLVFSLIREAYERQHEKAESRRLELKKNKEELQKSYTELTKLISIIAHDVRNPLASIEGYFELLTNDAIPKEEKAKLEKELLGMVQNTGHMLDDMVHWSKGQLGAYSTNFKTVSIGSWLNRTIDHLRGMAKAKGILIYDDYNGEEKMFCDPNLMTVVIRNLLQNAIKFTPPGKQINFKARSIEGGTWFEIKDQGIGIENDKIPALFSGKAESSLGTKLEQGTGFGLLIVKEYVDLHRGRVEVYSKVDAGSTFTVTIPNRPH